VKTFAVALILVAFGISQAFAEKINFAFSSSAVQTPLWIAKEQGFFNKHGLDVQLIFITGGRVVVQTLLAGDIQLGISAPGAVIRSDLAGGDLVFVAVASSTRIRLSQPKGDHSRRTTAGEKNRHWPIRGRTRLD